MVRGEMTLGPGAACGLIVGVLCACGCPGHGAERPAAARAVGTAPVSRPRPRDSAETVPPAVRRPIWIVGPDGWRELRRGSPGELIFVGPEDPLGGEHPIPLRLASSAPVPARIEVALRDRLIRVGDRVRGVDLSALRPAAAVSLLAAHARTVDTVIWRRPRYDPRVIAAIAGLPARDLTLWLDRPPLPLPPGSLGPLFARVTALILRGAGSLTAPRILDRFTRLEVLIVEGIVFPGAALQASTLRRLRQLRAPADAMGLEPPAGAGMPGFPMPKILPTLPTLPGLRHLRLKCSESEASLARLWPAVRNLETLVLDGCETTDDLLLGVSTLPRLAKLAIPFASRARPSPGGVRAIGRVGTLEELTLGSETLTDGSVEPLARLRRLRRLYLGGMLTDAAVVRLAPLVHLEDVELSFVVGGRGLAVIAGWRHLRRLRVGLRAGIPLAPLARLHQLRDLTIDEDSKPGVASSLGGLPALPRLRAFHFLGDLDPKGGLGIARQRGLVAVRLVVDAVPEGALRPLAALPDLVRLELIGAKIAPRSGLEELTRLRWLSLFPDGATPEPGLSRPPFGLDRLRDLRHLAIRFCARSLKGLATLTHLETLRLFGLPPEAMPELYAAIPSLRQLRALELAASATNDAGLRHLGGLRELRYLGLHQAKVTARGLPRLLGLRNLEVVDLNSTGISASAAAAFQRRHGTATAVLCAFD